MSGPPGFGKTTLAHVIAKQAGYNIIEINASDDRTGEVVKSKIKSALEMQAIIRQRNDKEKNMTMIQKPNLLIIDEIDGASTSGGGDVSCMIYFVCFNKSLLNVFFLEFY
jgi:chromosome transmission fidelity protein 18